MQTFFTTQMSDEFLQLSLFISLPITLSLSSLLLLLSSSLLLLLLFLLLLLLLSLLLCDYVLQGQMDIGLGTLTWDKAVRI